MEKNKLFSKVSVDYISALIAFVLSLLLKDIELYNQVGVKGTIIVSFRPACGDCNWVKNHGEETSNHTPELFLAIN